MLGWISRSAAKEVFPIGLDLGTARVKAVQMRRREAGGFEPLAAASMAYPAGTASSLTTLFRQTIRPLLDRANFSGRQVVLALPAAHMHVTRLRVPMWCDDAGAAEFVELHAPDWLPFPVSRAQIRRINAGEVYNGEEPSREIIVVAMRQDVIERYLDAAGAAKLQVASVIPEPLAILSFLAGIETSAPRARLLIDIGHRAIRVYAGKSGDLVFARIMHPDLDNVRLAEELRRCRAYVDGTFPNQAIEEAVFTGGGAQDVERCRCLSRHLGVRARVLTAQHPLNGSSWSVAAGLSLMDAAVPIPQGRCGTGGAGGRSSGAGAAVAADPLV